MLIRLGLFFLAFLAAIVIYPLHVAAADDPNQAQFTVAPVAGTDPTTTQKGYFIFQAKPGATITGALLLKSQADHAIVVTLAQVVAQTAQTGGGAYSSPGVKVTGPATWLKLDQSSVTLAPGTQQKVGFSVSVPGSVTPGQYLAGIAAYVVNAPPTTVSGAKQTGSSVTVQMRRIMPVEADVAGVWQSSLTIANVSLLEQPSGEFLGVQMRNDGVTFLKPFGKLSISDASGKLLATQAITMGTFVPDTEVTYPVPLANRPANGDYKISVDLTYDTSKVAHFDSTLTVTAASAQQPDQAAAPLSLPSGQQQPAASGAAAPDSSSTDATPWLVIGAGGLLVLAGLAVIFGMMRRQRTA